MKVPFTRTGITLSLTAAAAVTASLVMTGTSFAAAGPAAIPSSRGAAAGQSRVHWLT
jgi:hypothetical protein